jgi:flagellar FliL protein
MADEPDDIEDDEDGEEGEDGAKKKPNMMKLGLFIGLPVLILILGGVAAFMMLSGGDEDEIAMICDDHGEHCEPAPTEGHVAEAPPARSHYYDLYDAEGNVVSSILVNIRASDGRPLKLRLRVSFESTNPDLRPVLEEHLSPVLDQFITFLSELREDDLYGSAGTHRVRLELLRRVNLVIAPDRVDQVLIQEFMIAD